MPRTDMALFCHKMIIIKRQNIDSCQKKTILHNTANYTKNFFSVSLF